MKFGIALESFTPPGKTPDKNSITEMAKTAERLGFNSVWVWDHLLLGSRKVFPVLDSLTTLAYLSGVTSKVKLGTSVLIMTLRNPLVLSKILSSLQIYSEGRLVLGAASGWYEREFRATGSKFTTRGKNFEEEFQLVRKLLNESDVNYTGLNTRLEHATILPKSSIPIPMLMGGYSDRVLQRAGRLADGWISYYYTPEDYASAWGMVEKGANMANRDPAQLKSITLVPLAMANSYEEGDRVAREFTTNYMDLPKNTHCTPDSAIRGNLEDCVKQVRKFEEIGLDELVFIPSNYDIRQVERAGREILPVFSG